MIISSYEVKLFVAVTKTTKFTLLLTVSPPLPPAGLSEIENKIEAWECKVEVGAGGVRWRGSGHDFSCKMDLFQLDAMHQL